MLTDPFNWNTPSLFRSLRISIFSSGFIRSGGTDEFSRARLKTALVNSLMLEWNSSGDCVPLPLFKTDLVNISALPEADRSN